MFFGVDKFLKYGISGGVASAAFYLYNMNKSPIGAINLFGHEVPIAVAGLAAGVLASALTDVVHYGLYNSLSHETADYSSANLVAPAFSAAGVLGVAYLGNKELISDQWLYLAALGAGSQFIADKAFQVLAPMWGISQGTINEDLFVGMK